MSVHALLYTRTLGKLDLQLWIRYSLPGDWELPVKQLLSAVNCKDNTLSETVFAEFLENVMVDTVVFFMDEYNLVVLQHC